MGTGGGFLTSIRSEAVSQPASLNYLAANTKFVAAKSITVLTQSALTSNTSILPANARPVHLAGKKPQKYGYKNNFRYCPTHHGNILLLPCHASCGTSFGIIGNGSM